MTTPGPWKVYRCNEAPDDRACGIHGPSDPAIQWTVREGHSDVVSDTNHEECCHNMKLDDAKLIVDLRNETAIRTAVWESWGELGALDLRVGDTIDEDDVRLYNAHLAALRKALELMGMVKP